MADNRGSGVWVVAESRRGTLIPAAFELLTAAKSLAAQRGESVTAVVLGGAQGVEGLAAAGAAKVLVLEGVDGAVDDAAAAALAAAAKSGAPRTILLPATVSGRSVAPRLAVALGAGLAADAVALELDGEKRLVATRSGYAGNVTLKVLVKSVPEIATVRPMAYPRASVNGGAGTVEKAPGDASAAKARTKFVSFAADTSGEIDIGAAEKIVSGGRGLGDPKGFELVRELAHALGAAVGASRAAVDSGWIPYKHQVGITGRSVRPRLYVACGISGQIQHMGGMKSSDVIVAINTDADCPMMKAANYAVQGDFYKVVPALVAEIKKARGTA
ncbi:MAG: electron transfer flavoprotein subunit alpha/FixB family protein [Elusimicrobia bacterium]|nr:electron transfer flavoprotein subunit alpha/FixB family protein [Elusimicrobiota bacterium]